jgi:hypothetical protein
LEASILQLDGQRRGGLLGDTLAGPGGLVLTSFHIGAALLWRPSAAGGLGDETGDTSNTHVALTVASKSIVPSKASTTEAFEGLLAGVRLEVSLQVVASDEKLVAHVALVRTVIEMSLNVGFDVLLATKAAIAAVIQAHIFAIFGIRARNVLGDLFARNACVSNGRSDSGIEVNLAETPSLWLGLGHRRRCRGDGALLAPTGGGCLRHVGIAW